MPEVGCETWDTSYPGVEARRGSKRRQDYEKVKLAGADWASLLVRLAVASPASQSVCPFSEMVVNRIKVKKR